MISPNNVCEGDYITCNLKFQTEKFWTFYFGWFFGHFLSHFGHFAETLLIKANLHLQNMN